MTNSSKKNGFTPGQKFIVALLLFITIAAIGIFIMALTGSMTLPL